MAVAYGQSLIQAKQGRHLLFGALVLIVLILVAMFFAHREGLLDPERIPEYLDAAGKKPVPFLIGGLLLLMVVVMSIKTFVDIVSVFRFGLGTLQMDPAPGSIGGQIGGRIRMRYALKPDDIATVSITCYRRYVRRSHGKSESRVERFWSDQVRPEISGQFGDIVMYFTVDIPADLPPSGDRDEDHFYWEASLRIDRPGRDVVRSFNIPVTADEVPRQATRPMGEPTRSAGGRESFPGLSISESSNGLEVRCLPGRALGLNTVLFVFGAIAGGVGVGLGIGVAGRQWMRLLNGSDSTISLVFDGVFAVMTSFMAFVFGIIGLLLLIISIAGLLNRRQVTIDTTGVRTRNLGGLHVLSMADLETFELTETSSSGSDAWYDIHAITQSGERVALAEAVPGKAAARHVSGLIEKYTNIPVQELSKQERRARKRERKMTRRMQE